MWNHLLHRASYRLHPKGDEAGRFLILVGFAYTILVGVACSSSSLSCPRTCMLQHPATNASLGGYFGVLEFGLRPASAYIQARISQVAVMSLSYSRLPSITQFLLALPRRSGITEVTNS